MHPNHSFIDKNIIQSFELGIYPSTKVKCEPMMSKRNLYPTLSKVGNYSKYTKNMIKQKNIKTEINQTKIQTI